MNTGHIQEKTHVFDVRVYYEDTDAGGIVYYANYLKFAERGRTEFLRHKGVHQQVLAQETRTAFVVSEMSVRYKNPAKLDDIVQVKTTIETCSKISITFKQDLFVEERLMASLHVVVVAIDADTGRPKNVPEKVKEVWREYKDD